MVFALLIAAILWNLGTWWFGLPASSSHTLVGSIIGVGIANQIMAAQWNIGRRLGTGANVGKVAAALAFDWLWCAACCSCRAKRTHSRPRSSTRRRRATRLRRFPFAALLVLTCTGVSFFHGSNDGQKGMGLIMLILIGTVPTAYAFNHAVTYKESQDFIAASRKLPQSSRCTCRPEAVYGADARATVTDYIRTKEFSPTRSSPCAIG